MISLTNEILYYLRPLYMFYVQAEGYSKAYGMCVCVCLLYNDVLLGLQSFVYRECCF